MFFKKVKHIFTYIRVQEDNRRNFRIFFRKSLIFRPIIKVERLEEIKKKAGPKSGFFVLILLFFFEHLVLHFFVAKAYALKAAPPAAKPVAQPCLFGLSEG